MQGRRFSWLYTLLGLVASLFAYGFAHSTMRLAASWNLGENDPVSAINAQSFERLLSSGAAPFDVLVFGLSALFGLNALVFQILRYGLLAIALVFVFLIARRASGSGFWAFLTVEAYALIYQISWRFHEGFTYPLITIVAVAGVFWAICEEKTGYFRRLSLILFCTLGVLAGIWFAVFLACLLCVLTFNVRTLSRVSMAIIAIALSASLFLLANDGLWFQHISGSGNIFTGGAEAGLKIFAYLSPLLPIVVLLFAPSFLKPVEAESDVVRLVRQTTLVAGIGLVLAGLVMRGAPYPEHALMPLLFLTPIWLIDRVRRGMPNLARIKMYVALCLALMVIAFGARAANLYVLDPVCKRCYFGIPYRSLAEKLHEHYASPNGLHIVTPDVRTAGNVLVFWPKTDPITVFFANQKSAALNNSVPTLLVWPADMTDENVEGWLNSRDLSSHEIASLRQTHKTFEIGWSHWWRQTGYRNSRWKAAVLKTTQ